jgi:hypothetical protein
MGIYIKSSWRCFMLTQSSWPSEPPGQLDAANLCQWPIAWRPDASHPLGPREWFVEHQKKTPSKACWIKPALIGKSLKKKVVRDWSYPKTEFRTADNWWILMGCMEDLQHVDGVLYKNSWRFWVSMFPCYHQILGERLCFYRRGDIS